MNRNFGIRGHRSGGQVRHQRMKSTKATTCLNGQQNEHYYKQQKCKNLSRILYFKVVL